MLGAARESATPGDLLVAEGVPMTHSELARYADVSVRTVKPALEMMVSLGMVVVDGDVIRLPNFNNRQYESDDVTRRTREHRERSKEQGRNVPKNVRRNVPETETETETEQIKTSSVIADALTDRDDVERLCQHLADRVEANGNKRPTITKQWRTQCRLLLDRDGRTEAQVRTAIDWCQQDPFWSSNILSMPKLREKYDTLRGHASRKVEPMNGRRVLVPSYETPPEPDAADLPW